MGDPRRQRKKYKSPKILWNSDKIEVEKELVKEYGLKNKKEVWKATSVLRKYTGNAKKLIVATSKQADIEKQQLLKKVVEYGFLPQSAKLEDVLGLTLKDILNRRIQTIIFKQGLTRSIKQSRQFITHEHLFVGDKKITAPSYLVKVSEESQVHFDNASSLSSIEHSEREIIEKKEKPKKKDSRKPVRRMRKGMKRGAPSKGGKK